MDCYLEAVKEQDVDIGKLSQLYPSFCRNWPTFLNTVVTKGEDYWNAYIDVNNYNLTAQQYTSGQFPKYSEWLRTRNFTKNVNILNELIKFSESSNLLDKFDGSSSDFRFIVLHEIFSTDNVHMFEYALQKLTLELNDFSFNQAFYKALEYKAVGCVDKCARMLEGKGPRSLGLGILKALSMYRDHSLVHRLKKHLDVTNYGPDQLVVQSIIQSKGLREAMIGSEEVVKTVIDGGNAKGFMCCLASRIAYEEGYAEIIRNYSAENNLLLDNHWNDNLANEILSSRRNYNDTVKIVTSLNRAGVVFNKETRLDLSLISYQSWHAIMETGHLLNLKLAVANSHSFDAQMLLGCNKSGLRTITKFMHENLTDDVLIDQYAKLGSSHTQWAWNQGYFPDLTKVEEDDFLPLACLCGNVFILAVWLDHLQAQGKPPQREQFHNVWMNKETLPFLEFWFNASSRQKDIFVFCDFGTNFFDSSRYVSNNTYKRNLSGDCTRRQLNYVLFDSIFLDRCREDMEKRDFPEKEYMPDEEDEEDEEEEEENEEDDNEEEEEEEEFLNPKDFLRER